MPSCAASGRGARGHSATSGTRPQMGGRWRQTAGGGGGTASCRTAGRSGGSGSGSGRWVSSQAERSRVSGGRGKTVHQAPRTVRAPTAPESGDGSARSSAARASSVPRTVRMSRSGSAESRRSWARASSVLRTARMTQSGSGAGRRRGCGRSRSRGGSPRSLRALTSQASAVVAPRC